MRNALIILLMTAFAFAGIAQKEQPKKPSTKKSVTTKKSPTPSKKASSQKKGSTDKKTTAAKKKPASDKSANTKKTATSKPKPKATPKPTPPKKDDKADFEKATALTAPEEKTAALTAFLTDHPKSTLRTRALESLTAARVVAGEAKFEAGESEAGAVLFKQAVVEAPVPYSERLFNEIISKIPAGLYWRGERSLAIELAQAIEKNSLTSVPQLLSLASFYLGTENGAEAKRLAEAALKLDEKSVVGYQTLGLANRLNFDLEQSAAAYAKALELDPASVAARRSLAEMKRALGKPDEAAELYAAILEKDPNDVPAKTGQILSLFGAGKRAEAEAELAKSLETNPSNVLLLAGAAYWYASNDNGAKAVELAEKAIALDPRFIWSHIALGRGQLVLGKIAEAEQTLVKARKYGNFPTLEYEIASARLAAGFYREAAEELQKSFTVSDGMVKTRLGGRVERAEKSFTDLLAFERRASIFETKAADNAENAERLKSLLELNQALATPAPDADKTSAIADAFVKGDDKMRLHRQLYAASQLLEKKVALPKVIELTKTAVASVDDGLSVPIPAGPIMASELYESRNAALLKDQFIVVPDVPKQTLSAIVRGRIEEMAGAAFFYQNNYPDAVTRLRRAVSVLPEKSAWWRSSMWRLGSALEADGKDKDALDAYVKSYTSDAPSPVKYVTVESIYKRVNGNTDGLEALVGANPAPPSPTMVKTAADPVTTEIKSTTDTNTIKTEEPPKPVETDAKKAETIKISEKPVKPKLENTEIPKPTPSEVKTDDKQDAKATDPKPSEKTDATPVKTDSQAKPLFDPVVIEVKTDKPKSTEESSKETPADPKKDTETKTGDSTDAAKPKTETTETDTSGSARPRVVDGKEIVSDVPQPCSINVSQETISLIGGGGSVGLLVGLEPEADVKQIKAVASSPKDIEVTLEPEIAGVSGRSFYVVKSLTTTTGVYQITFTAPCGKKDVIVRVR